METQQGTTLRLHGTLDDEGCAAVRRELGPALSGGLRHLVLDLAEVRALTPAGIAMLRGLDGHLRSQRGGLIVLHPTADVLRTLRIHDLQHLLEVRDLEPRGIRSGRPAARQPESESESEAVAGVIPLVRRA